MLDNCYRSVAMALFLDFAKLFLNQITYHLSIFRL